MSLVKAKLSDNKGHELEVQFNPETLSIEHQTFGEESRKRPGRPVGAWGCRGGRPVGS